MKLKSAIISGQIKPGDFAEVGCNETGFLQSSRPAALANCSSASTRPPGKANIPLPGSLARSTSRNRLSRRRTTETASFADVVTGELWSADMRTQ